MPNSRLTGWANKISRRYAAFLSSHAQREQGSIGPVAYLFWLRALVIVAIAARLLFPVSPTPRSSVSFAFLIIGVMIALQIMLRYFIRQHKGRPAQGKRTEVAEDVGLSRAWSVTAFLDVGLISLTYWVAGAVPGAPASAAQSDIFLLYVMPVLAAAEYLRLRWVLVLSLGAIPVGFFFALLGMGHSFASLAPLFFWRLVYLVMVVTVSVSLTRLQHTEKQQLVEGKRQLSILFDLRRQLELSFEEDHILAKTLKAIKGLTEAAGIWRSNSDQKLEADPISDSNIPANDFVKCRMVAEDCAVSKTPRRDRRIISVPIENRGVLLGVLLGVFPDPLFSGPPTPAGLEASDNEEFLRALADAAASAIARARRIHALGEISLQTAEIQRNDERIESLLRELMGTVEFEYALVSVVDEYRNVIENTRGRNVPMGWMRRACYPLSANDIIARVAASRQREVISGWDERFNEEIYKRYGHERFIRVWTPIQRDGRVIGVLEAGCDRKRERSIFTDINLARVDHYADALFDAVAGSRPAVLGDRIARHAQSIVGAAGASVCVYEGDDVVLQAGSGLAKDIDFVQHCAAECRNILPDGCDMRPFRPAHAPGLAAKAFRLQPGEGRTGLICVYFAGEHEFDEAEDELERSFARLVSVSLLNSQLLARLARTTELAWTVSSYQRVLESLSSSLKLNDLLKQLTDNILALFDADNVVLHQFDESRKRFRPEPVTSGAFRDKQIVKPPFTQGSLPWQLIRAGHTRFVKADQIDEWGASPNPDKKRFVAREGIRSCAALVLRSREPDELVGVLFVNYRSPQAFPLDQQEAMRALASSAAVAIHTARLRERAEVSLTIRGAEHDAVIEVDRFLARRDFQLDPLLKLILEKALHITSATSGALLRYDKQEDTLIPLYPSGKPFPHLPDKQSLDAGIVGRAGKNRQSLLVDDVTAEPWIQWYEAWAPDMRSELAVPMYDAEGLLGVLNLEHPDVEHFTEEHQLLVETLALQAVIAIRSVELRDDIPPLLALGMVAARIQMAPYDLDTTLRIILTGVTAGQGLRCSRAALFVLDKRTQTLRGRICIGPWDKKEADDTWPGLHEAADRAGSDKEALHALLEAAVIPMGNLSRLDQEVRKISLLLTEEREWAQAIGTKRGGVTKGSSNVFQALYGRLSDIPLDLAFVPLMLPDNSVVGLLIVDRAYQPKPAMSERELPILSAFAELAAIVIENDRYRAQSGEERQDQSLKDFLAEVMHEAGRRNGAVRKGLSQLWERAAVLDGSRQITEKLSDVETAAARVDEEIARLKQFSHPMAPFKTLDLCALLRRVAEEFGDDEQCKVDAVLPEHKIDIPGDRQRLEAVFCELVRNGKEAALEGSGPPRVTVRLTTADGKAAVEVHDNGRGLPDGDPRELFRPGVSLKKDKGQGLRGLGLAIAQGTVRVHGGTITADNSPAGGARFTVILPMTEVGSRAHAAGG